MSREPNSALLEGQPRPISSPAATGTPPAAPRPRGGDDDAASNRGRKPRAALVAAMLAALALTTATNGLVRRARENTAQTNGIPDAARAAEANASNASSLNAMPSYATALLLGGLRGPLVMVLWTTSENQKQERDLRDFDTKIEWIRLLQPEFDTVHLFQIWNKAYNVSAQMASLADKYSTILDALDYAHKVDTEKPDDINLIGGSGMGSVFSDKLGTSQEHPYYRRRVRRETQPLVRVSFPDARAAEFRAAATNLGWDEYDAAINVDDRFDTDNVLLAHSTADRLKTSFGGPDVRYDPQQPGAEQHGTGWRRTHMDAVLDAQGMLRPALVRPRLSGNAAAAASGKSAATDLDPIYDGSELQCLEPFQPFPYGVSAMALGYNYHKRAQMLARQWGESPIQFSDQIIDGRPALVLSDWARDEWERGRRAELRLDRKDAPEGADLDALDTSTEDATFGPGVDPVELGLAEYSYDLAATLYERSRAEFEEHLRRYPNNLTTYQSHVDEAIGGAHLMRADAAALRAFTAPAGSPRPADQVAAAVREYTLAQRQYGAIVLRYYMGDDIAKAVYPVNPATGRQSTRADVDQLPTGELLDTLSKAIAYQAKLIAQGSYDESKEDREAYLRHVQRAGARIQRLLQTAPATQPK